MLMIPALLINMKDINEIEKQLNEFESICD